MDANPSYADQQLSKLPRELHHNASSRLAYNTTARVQPANSVIPSITSTVIEEAPHEDKASVIRHAGPAANGYMRERYGCFSPFQVLPQDDPQADHVKRRSIPTRRSAKNGRGTNSQESGIKQPCYLTTLPTELHLGILKELNIFDLLQVKQSSRYFRDVSTTAIQGLPHEERAKAVMYAEQCLFLEHGDLNQSAGCYMCYRILPHTQFIEQWYWPRWWWWIPRHVWEHRPLLDPWGQPRRFPERTYRVCHECVDNAKKCMLPAGMPPYEEWLSYHEPLHDRELHAGLREWLWWICLPSRGYYYRISLEMLYEPRRYLDDRCKAALLKYGELFTQRFNHPDAIGLGCYTCYRVLPDDMFLRCRWIDGILRECVQCQAQRWAHEKGISPESVPEAHLPYLMAKANGFGVQCIVDKDLGSLIQ